MSNLSRNQKRLAAASRGFDGLTAGRPGSLLGGLVARVAPMPASSRLAAPKHAQEAIEAVEEGLKVVEDYVNSQSSGGKS